MSQRKKERIISRGQCNLYGEHFSKIGIAKHIKLCINNQNIISIEGKKERKSKVKILSYFIII